MVRSSQHQASEKWINRKGPIIIFALYHFMRKRKTSFDLTLSPRDARTPAFRWLYQTVRAGILDGRLRPGLCLPATRDLARQYGLSRGTIVNAFDQLKSEGYLEGSMGSGTYVSTILPDALLQVSSDPKSQPRAQVLEGKPKRRVSNYAKRLRHFSNFQLRPSRAFRANLPALDLFPTTLWAQITAKRLRRASMNLLLGCDSMGYRPLREAVADYLVTSRGVNCVPDQIAIVSGVQEALDLVARIFLDPGDRVSMEEPGYIGAAMVFEAAGANVSAVPLDDQGMKLHPQRLRGSRLLYVTPGHQFPLGITMSLPRRLALLEWAGRSGALIFEDDYDSEYRYSGRPVPALQGLDRDGLVLLAGSFSKVLFPSLRLGYLLIPSDLLHYFAANLSVTSRHAPVLEQAVLCDFISQGHFGRHLRRMRQVYAERRSVLLESARQHLAGLLEISSVEAGLQTVGWLGGAMNAESATRAAAARGVEVVPLSAYHRGRATREGLQLGFAAVDAKEIRRGVTELAIALEESKALQRTTLSSAHRTRQGPKGRSLSPAT
jgi:GntR family transcriptional regulator / MocR family aminotransferase